MPAAGDNLSELASFHRLFILYLIKPAIECSRIPVKAIKIPMKVSSNIKTAVSRLKFPSG
ncbi:hypothetical protein [Methanosarcina sp. 2.H.A.1B.4]|uniref:hypothetical protein n=1 Tax=Methanosarcina sp. 2.H.A.1B.4 TaxID=1483600 RepID=UPI0012E06F4B|nr:hypothetical protein [Methanosarcina sp. 2.H.A.1B.4]